LDLHSAKNFLSASRSRSYFFVSIQIRRQTFGVYSRVGATLQDHAACEE
jgi:hypothetical protein